ncbi:spindle pole body assembly component Mps3p [Monosporozyma unispora]
MSQMANIDSIMSTHSRRSNLDGNSTTNDKTNYISNGTNNSNMTNEMERSRQSVRETYKNLLMEGVNTRQSPNKTERGRDVNRTPLYDDKNYINKESSIYKEFKKSLGDKKDRSRVSQRDNTNSKYDQLDYLDDTDNENGDGDYDYEQDDDEEEDINVTADEEDDDYDLDSLAENLNEANYYSHSYEKSPFVSDETTSPNDDDDDEYELDEPHEYSDEEVGTTKFTWKRLGYAFLALLVFGYFYRAGDESVTPISDNNNNSNNNVGGSFRSSPNLGSFTNIQKQINHLYNELSTRDKRWNSEFDEKLKIVISQFEKNIKKLLPPSLLNVESEIKSINTKIQHLQESAKNNNPPKYEFTLTNVTSLQNKLLNELEKELPSEIPVMVNNSSSILIIPEMHNYISHLLSNLIKYSNVTVEKSNESNKDKSPLNYDLNNYIKEILTNEFQYIDKEFFLNELNSKLQANKIEIFHDLKANIQLELSRFNGNKNSGFPERYSTVLLKRLINQIYDANQHQWGNDLDFMTFAQGTRLLKSLTSLNSPRGNGVAPMQMLSDSKLDSTSTYWQCQVNGQGQCNLAIRFNKPIHLTKISYLHGRFTNNLHMMNSAPRKISIYVKLNNGQDTSKLQHIAERFNEGEMYTGGDKSFIKIQSYEYDIFSKKIKQNFPLPTWFIQFKPLVKSMIFQIDSNYGNKDYTSLKKFIVNGVTETDLSIMKAKSFPMHDYKNNETASPDYHYDYNAEQQPAGQPRQQQITLSSKIISPKDNNNNNNNKPQNVPSFGDDQKVV